MDNFYIPSYPVSASLLSCDSTTNSPLIPPFSPPLPSPSGSQSQNDMLLMSPPAALGPPKDGLHTPARTPSSSVPSASEPFFLSPGSLAYLQQHPVYQEQLAIAKSEMGAAMPQEIQPIQHAPPKQQSLLSFFSAQNVPSSLPVQEEKREMIAASPTASSAKRGRKKKEINDDSEDNDDAEKDEEYAEKKSTTKAKKPVGRPKKEKKVEASEDGADEKPKVKKEKEPKPKKAVKAESLPSAAAVGATSMPKISSEKILVEPILENHKLEDPSPVASSSSSSSAPRASSSSSSSSSFASHPAFSYRADSAPSSRDSFLMLSCLSILEALRLQKSNPTPAASALANVPIVEDGNAPAQQSEASSEALSSASAASGGPASSSSSTSIQELMSMQAGIAHIRKDNVFDSDISKDELGIIAQRVRLQQMQFQEFEKRERQRKVAKIRAVHDHISEEEAMNALEEFDGNEAEATVKLTDPVFLYDIRKRIAQEYMKALGTRPPSHHSIVKSSSGSSSAAASSSSSSSSAPKKAIIPKKTSLAASSSEEPRAKISAVEYKRFKLKLDDALESNCKEGWSSARIRAFELIDSNPNAYFYRFNSPQERQRNGPWTQEEHDLFVKRMEDVGVNGQWGIFSMAIPGRVGYQCSNYYRAMIKRGVFKDPNYAFDETGHLYCKIGKGCQKRKGVTNGREIILSAPPPLASSSSSSASKKAKPKSKSKDMMLMDDSDNDDDNHSEEEEDDTFEEVVAKPKVPSGPRAPSRTVAAPSVLLQKQVQEREMQIQKQNEKKIAKGKKVAKRRKGNADTIFADEVTDSEEERERVKQNKKPKKVHIALDSTPASSSSAAAASSSEPSSSAADSKTAAALLATQGNDEAFFSMFKDVMASDDDGDGDGSESDGDDFENPLPGFKDIITLDEVDRPAISPYGHVLGMYTWTRCLTKQPKNTCPFTKKPLSKRQLVRLTLDNIAQYRDKIIQ